MHFNTAHLMLTSKRVTVINSPSVKHTYCCVTDETTENQMFLVPGERLPTWLLGKGGRLHTGTLFPQGSELTGFSAASTMCPINPTTKEADEEGISHIPSLLLGSDSLSWLIAPLHLIALPF